MSPTLFGGLALVALSWAGVEADHGSDTDDDTWPDNVDCAPEDPSIFPGGVELCDQIDNDCDEEIDEDCPIDEPDEPEEGGCAKGAGLLLPLLLLRRRLTVAGGSK